MFPNVPVVESYFHDVRGERFLVKGMLDEAVADFIVGYDVNFATGGGAEAIGALTGAYSASGIKGFWQKELDLAIAHYQMDVELAARQSPGRYVTPYKLATLYARTGDTERAFALLEDSYNHRDENLLWVKPESLRPGSPWHSLTADPRLVEMIGRLGLGG